jgi:N-acetylneuraminic acid mutarotase
MWVFGVGPGNFNDGASYDPASNSWSSISDAPNSMGSHRAVWTGQEMLAFGGILTTAVQRYNPDSNTWQSFNPGTAPTHDGNGYKALWTGSKMFIWDGFDREGALFDPQTGQWSSVSTVNAPSSRIRYSLTWTGTEIIIWGGRDYGISDVTNTGARYNPETNEWAVISVQNAPVGRQEHTAVWTGSELFIWGGRFEDLVTFTNSGGRYDPTTNTWSAMSTMNAPEARVWHVATWNGSEMGIYYGWAWDGPEAVEYSSYGVYNPTTNSWTVDSLTPRTMDSYPAHLIFNNNLYIAYSREVPPEQLYIYNSEAMTQVVKVDLGSNNDSAFIVDFFSHFGFLENALHLNDKFVFLADDIPKDKSVGFAVNPESEATEIIPMIPGIEVDSLYGPGVSTGNEILKFVTVEEGQPGRVYSWKPATIMHVYQKF